MATIVLEFETDLVADNSAYMNHIMPVVNEDEIIMNLLHYKDFNQDTIYLQIGTDLHRLKNATQIVEEEE